MFGRTPEAEALTALILEVFRLNGRLLAAGDRLTRSVGQTSARWQVLGAIRHTAEPVAGIARAMGLARQSVQRTADVLEAEGLVEFADNPAHRRAKLVRLTPRGQAILAEISRRQAEWTNGLGAALRLQEKDIRQALDVVGAFREALEREAREYEKGGSKRETNRTGAIEGGIRHGSSGSHQPL